METTEGVANFFIGKSLGGDCSDLSQLKLQKLAYFAHGWHLGLSGDPLFAEPIQAWRYGPVILSLRREFGGFGNKPITRKATDIVFNGTGELVEQEQQLRQVEIITPFLNKVWEVYKSYTPIQLANLTHEKGTPWHQVAEHFQFNIPAGTTIPNQLIQGYFQRLLRPSKQEAALAT